MSHHDGFIDTLYADPLLKFLVDTSMKSFVIFAVAGLFARVLPAQIGGDAWFRLGHGGRWMPRRLVVALMLPKWEIQVLPEMPIRI